MEIEKIDEDTSSKFGYICYLKGCYKDLNTSRLVKNRETDQDALEYFQNTCNRALPRNEAESTLKQILLELYRSNRTAFSKCLEGAPHFFLLIEARALVHHFGIHDLIYMEWKNDKYEVLREKKKKKAKKLTLEERVAQLEEAIKSLKSG